MGDGQDHDLETRAQEEEFLVGFSAGQEALDHAIGAAELYISAVGEALTPSEKSRLKRKFNLLIGTAERLRAGSPSPGPPSDHDLLLRASTLHGTEFKPWNAIPPDTIFLRAPADPLYTDNTAFSLSDHQLAILDGWKRPDELPPSRRSADARDPGEDDVAFMGPGRDSDLVQDVTADCSVVASLCAAMRLVEAGNDSILAPVLYPYSQAKGRPIMSETGMHVLRMYFNGCFRRVVIDNRLPCSRTGRALYALDRAKPTFIWLALLEKAYLKVRGGYDFPGSNSATDLHVITGWIPEQILLQSEDLDIDEIWDRIVAAHKRCQVAVTLGTGPIPASVTQALGLVPEHVYAVLDLQSVSGVRQLLVKNPWSEGPAWRGSAPSPVASVPDWPNAAWITLEDAAHNFDSLYLNWDPAMFAHRRDLHFAWKIPPAIMGPALAYHRQVVMSTMHDGPICILLCRHFSDVESAIVREPGESLAATSQKLGFISILVSRSDGRRVDVTERVLHRSPIVDSHQVMARLDATAGQLYTVIPVQRKLPLPEYSFTLSFLSERPVELQDAGAEMANYAVRMGAWTRRTAGGPAGSATYLHNPQYSISVPRPTPISILLTTGAPSAAVRVELVWARGERVISLDVKSVIAHSGGYDRGCALAKSTVEAGTYTVVCSTFEPGHLARFALRVGTQCPATLREVPARTAGRLRTPLPPLVFRVSEERKRISLRASRLTRASVEIKPAEQAPHRGSRAGISRPPPPPRRMTVMYGSPPQATTILAVSAEGQFRVTDNKILLVPDFDIEPDQAERRGLWLVVEQQAGWGQQPTSENTSIDIEILSDNLLTAGSWQETG